MNNNPMIQKHQNRILSELTEELKSDPAFCVDALVAVTVGISAGVKAAREKLDAKARAVLEMCIGTLAYPISLTNAGDNAVIACLIAAFSIYAPSGPGLGDSAAIHKAWKICHKGVQSS